jgi:hypothetical protein
MPTQIAIFIWVPTHFFFKQPKELGLGGRAGWMMNYLKFKSPREDCADGRGLDPFSPRKPGEGGVEAQMGRKKGEEVRCRSGSRRGDADHEEGGEEEGDFLPGMLRQLRAPTSARARGCRVGVEGPQKERTGVRELRKGRSEESRATQ